VTVAPLTLPGFTSRARKERLGSRRCLVRDIKPGNALLLAQHVKPANVSDTAAPSALLMKAGRTRAAGLVDTDEALPPHHSESLAPPLGLGSGRPRCVWTPLGARLSAGETIKGSL
jgi:hypothetical protein